jgi:hypothetical protein
MANPKQLIRHRLCRKPRAFGLGGGGSGRVKHHRQGLERVRPDAGTYHLLRLA